MPFIGNQPALSYTSFAKQDFTTSATTSYTLDNPVANENELALFINFVRQEPTTAYTASGTSLTLTSATFASDDMYCVYLGKAVQTVNPPNGSVGTSQLVDGAVTSAKLSGITQGISNVQSFCLDSDQTKSGAGYFNSNIVANTDSGYGGLGSIVSQSSGTFSFSATGLYLIGYTVVGQPQTTPDTFSVEIRTTTNNSTYFSSSEGRIESPSSSNDHFSTFLQCIFNVSDTTNRKVRFGYGNGNSASSIQFFGDSASRIATKFDFIRLGDSV